jgi:hypothetical protein
MPEKRQKWQGYENCESTAAWRLQREPVKTWLDANHANWWAGGTKLACKPEFFLVAFGERRDGSLAAL